MNLMIYKLTDTIRYDTVH